MKARIAIIYLAYNPEPFWAAAERGLLLSTYPKEQTELIIVDNPHETFGSAKNFFVSKVLPKSNKDLPRITFLAQTENLGFAGGMNVGIKAALELKADYIFLHNQDGYLSPTALAELVKAFEEDVNIGAAQSLIRLSPETNLVNTAGNKYNFLGFGFSGLYRKKFEPLAYNRVIDIGYASGAALMLSAKVLSQVGLLEDSFESYHEDLEFGLRLHLAGFRCVLVGESYFFHSYEFSRNTRKYYLMERNRFAVLLMYYRLLTLTIISPVLFLVEIAVFFEAARHGWLKSKISATKYWLNFKHLTNLVKLRARTQKLRKISDRRLLSFAVGSLDIGHTGHSNPLLTYLGNPFLSAYLWLVKTLIFW